MLDNIQLLQAKQHIQESLSKPLTISQLARKLGSCSTTLKICFKKHYQITIHQYQLTLRMEKAKKLLNSTTWTIQEIAEGVGYTEGVNFSTAFKQYFDETPSQFRTRSLKDNDNVIKHPKINNMTKSISTSVQNSCKFVITTTSTMQHLISWKQCLIYSGFAVFIYYGLILFKFYRKDLFLRVKIFTPHGATPSPHLSPTPLSVEEKPAPDTTLYNIVLEFMEDCKPVFHATVQQSLEREQVLEALQIRIQKYPRIKGTAFQVAVTNHIEQELQNRCGLSLTAAELNQLW